MTDQLTVSEACLLVGKRFATPCVLCNSRLRHSSRDNVTAQMAQHSETCSLRIVIEAALKNTEVPDGH